MLRVDCRFFGGLYIGLGCFILFWGGLYIELSFNSSLVYSCSELTVGLWGALYWFTGFN